MNRRNAAVVVIGILCSIHLVPAAALSATSIQRDFQFAAGKIQVDAKSGVVNLDLPGATRELRPGRPDLPSTVEVVDVPAGMRITSVHVVDLQTAPLASGVKLVSAAKAKPGLGPIERTTPDPAFFGHSGMQPQVPVSLGYQGFQRGRHIAYLLVTPVRWDAATGRLERVTRLRIELSLAPSTETALDRERIVPEWEDDRLAQTPGRLFSTDPSAGVRNASPGSIKKPAFQATQLPSVLGSPVAYVIVTNDSLAPQFQRLADWKTQNGMPAVVRTMAVIRQQYPYGTDDADRVRQFLRDAYRRWGTKWVLLGGDVDVVPTRLAYTTFYVTAPDTLQDIATDMYYSCLDGNWNADGDYAYGEGLIDSVLAPGDNVDLLPDVYVGRAPVSHVSDAKLFVDKTLQYEKTPVGDYENSVLYFAEVLFPQNWQPGDYISLDGAQLAEETLPYLRAHGGVHYARLYQNYTDSRWEPGSLPENLPTVIDSLNRGYNMSVHIGHGYRNVMSVGHEQNLVNADAMGLVNGNRVTNLYSINCTSNAIDFPCIGEAFLLAPNGGAVTNVGSTRLDFPSAGRVYQKEFFRLIFQDSVTAVGEAEAKQKLPFVGYSSTDNVNRWMQFTLILLGDPELRIFTARPRTLTVAHPGSIFVTDSTLAVNVKVAGVALAGARVTAYKANDEYRIGTTDASGNITLPFRPDTTGSLTLTVSAYDARPYQNTIAITNGAQPVLSGRPAVIDDDAVGGSNGNANGLIDAGEVVDLKVQVRNNGTSASSVTGTLSSADTFVSVTAPVVSYGSIAGSSTSAVTSAYRIVVPTTPVDSIDTREVTLKLRLTDSGGRSWNERVPITLHASNLRHYSEIVIDNGNANGRPDPGETVQYLLKLRNIGSGIAQSVTAKLRSWNGLATITDSTASWGNINPGEEKQADAVVFIPSSANAKLELRVSDLHGLVFSHILDLGPPAAPIGLSGLGGTSSVQLTWKASPEPDLLGYNVYRSSNAGGPFIRLTGIPSERTSYYVDNGLTTLTRYYYQVTAVDSSGSESDRSPVYTVSTNPPSHAIFPIPLGSASHAPVAVDHVWPGYPLSIVSGSSGVLYAWNPDGSAPVDADGSLATSGDFTVHGTRYDAAPSIADINGDGNKEIVASAWDSLRTYAFDRSGHVLPGWPVSTTDAVWSTAVLADLDNDGKKEVVFGSNGYNIYAFHFNGTEVRDGDNNPATIGVFQRVPTPYNFSTPAVADIDGDGKREVIITSAIGVIYALRADGTSPPGWSVNLAASGANIYSSPAIGDLDNNSELDIVTAMQRSNGSDSIYVLRANGQRHAGWPRPAAIGGMDIAPSPALADMNNDGKLDVVYAGTDGKLYVYNGYDGSPIAPLNGVHFSTLSAYATESSPVVADINGDGLNDIVIGDELGYLTAISGDGTVLPGFPILTGAEVKGSPALCDCDGDGKTEIVFSGYDSKLYVWDYDFPFSPNGPPPWPQFHHDAAHTGFVGTQVFVGVDDQPASQVRALELAAPMPNPAPIDSRLSWGVPSDRAGAPFELSIFDLSGRRVRMLERGPAVPGRHMVQWNLRDDHGSRVEAGVFFVKFTLDHQTRSQKIVVVH